MRYELTDYEWVAIKPFQPNKPRGVPRVNDRRVLNGIFWVLCSGAPLRDLPDVRRQRSLDRTDGLNKGEFLAHRNVHRSEDETANPTIEGTG